MTVNEYKIAVNEYKIAVMNLFKSGDATEKHWTQLANAVLYCSEDDYIDTSSIDKSCDPEGWEELLYE